MRRVPGRLATALLLVAAAAVGAASATAALVLSGALSHPGPARAWSVSAAIVGTASAFWFAGTVLSVLLAATAARPTRLQGWIAAFGLAPLAVALFFFIVGVSVTGGVPGGYAVVAGIAAFSLFARRLLPAIAEKLLVCFFVWLALLVLPVVWSDPVSEAFSTFLLRLLRVSGVIV